MEETQDPNKGKDFFLGIAKSFLKLLNLPMITTKEDAEGLIAGFDPMVDELTKSMKETGNLYSSETILLLGSALGEAFILSFGGEWHYSEKQKRWVILAPMKDGTNAELNVFRKVLNRVENGMEDSISFYFESTKKILNGELGI